MSTIYFQKEILIRTLSETKPVRRSA